MGFHVLDEVFLQRKLFIAIIMLAFKSFKSEMFHLLVSFQIIRSFSHMSTHFAFSILLAVDQSLNMLLVRRLRMFALINILAMETRILHLIELRVGKGVFNEPTFLHKAFITRLTFVLFFLHKFILLIIFILLFLLKHINSHINIIGCVSIIIIITNITIRVFKITRVSCYC